MPLSADCNKEDSISKTIESEDGSSTRSEASNHSPFHNVKVFLMLMCIFSMTQGFAINGINNVNIVMYERRFGLSSRQTGLVASFYDVTAGCTVLAAGYFATQFHQPRLISIASLLLAIGSLVMALPHFTTGYYEPSGTRQPICYNVDNTTADVVCVDDRDSLPDNLYTLLVGQGLHGLAGTVLYAIAPAYLDGSVSSKQSPTYLGLFYGSAALGPAIGYLVGSQMLDIYVDTPKQPPGQLSVNSPAWVGAWWIGFLASFTSCFILAIPIFTFPRVLPGTEERRKNNVSQEHHHSSTHKANKSDFGISVRDIPASLWLLLKNPAFICQCLISSVEGLLISGLSTFLPKFIANQFNQKASWAALLTGFIAIPGAVFGQFLGGIIVHRFKLKVQGMMKFNMGCSAIILLAIAVFFVKCENKEIAGITKGYNRAAISEVDLLSSCNEGCNCDGSLYDPVCAQGVEYFTPCHAGCTSPAEEMDINGKISLVFQHCNCTTVYNNTDFLQSSDSNRSSNIQTISGKCENDCKMLYVFLPITLGALISMFMMSVPGATIVLRSVNDKQRTFALSVQQMTMRFIGTIPGPLLFGDILDNVCEVWQTACDGSERSCWIYSQRDMGLRFFIVLLCAKLTTISLLVIAYRLYQPPADPQTSEDSESNEEFDKMVKVSADITNTEL